MKTICSSLMAMALLTPLAAHAADELVDGASASMGAGLEVDFRSTAGPGRTLDVASTPAAGLSAPMQVDARGLDAAGARVLSPFDGQRADALPRPVPPMSDLDVFAGQVRGTGIEAIEWLAPRVRYRSTLPELQASLEGDAGAVRRELLDLTQPPFGVTLEPLRSGGRLSEVSVDPVFGLPRYARAWKLGTRGTLYAGVAPVEGVGDLYARAAAGANASSTPTVVSNTRLAGRAAVMATGPRLAVALAPIDEFYAVVAVLEGPAAHDAPFVAALLRGLSTPPGLDRDAAIAEALTPGAGVHFQVDTGSLDGTLATALAWQATPSSLPASAVSAAVRNAYGFEVSLSPLLGVPTPVAAPLAPAGVSYAVLAPPAPNQPTTQLGQINVAAAADRPERVAAFVARALQAPPAVTLLDGRYLLTGQYLDTTNPLAPTSYAYRATLTPLIDGTTFVTQSFFLPTSQAASLLHAHPALDLALPTLAGQTEAPAAGPALPAMNIAVRRATRRTVVAPGAAAPVLLGRSESSVPAQPGLGAAGVGYGTGGLVLTYEPLTLRGYMLTGAQFGRIVNPEGNDEDGGFDFFAHARYELPTRYLPDLTTEVSAGVHVGVAGTSAFGLGLRAAAHYRLAGPLTGWLALQSVHYPNPEINGTWLALSVGLGYRPQ